MNVQRTAERGAGGLTRFKKKAEEEEEEEEETEEEQH
jgi:hypothetical protein